jgi:hypothetical protein
VREIQLALPLGFLRAEPVMLSGPVVLCIRCDSVADGGIYCGACRDELAGTARRRGVVVIVDERLC